MIHYVIESNDNRNLLTFLIPNFDFESGKFLLVLKNEQFKLQLKLKETIFQKMYAIIIANKEFINDCVEVIEKLLIEMVEINDIELECNIQTVLNMDESSSYKDKILRLLILYWNFDFSSLKKYKKKLFLTDKLIDLMIMLKKGCDEKTIINFKTEYSSYLIKLKKNIKNENNANMLLSIALKNGHKEAMDTIVANKDIKLNNVYMEESFSTHENRNYLFKVMLKYGHNVDNFPESLINFKTFEDSLDARIVEEYGDNIKIDYNSIDNKDPIFFGLNILTNHIMKNIITHPVLSIMINLKALKYQRFHVLNFWTFLLFYVLLNFLILYRNEMNTWLIWLAYILCVIETIILFIREYFQFINTKQKTYFKKHSNQFEVVLILLSVLVILMIPFSKIIGSYVITCLSTLLIIFSTIEVLILIPYPSMVIYMIMFKNVAVTFWKFLFIFFFIIFAFAFSFFIVMKPVVVENEHLSNDEIFNSTKLEIETIIEKSLKKFADEENISHNFENLFTSIFKTIQMLSGEFTIEPFSLDNYLQNLLFFFFVITSLILFNFIIGLVINDIQNVKIQADVLILKYQALKTFRTSTINHTIDKKIKEWNQNKNKW